VGLLSTSAPLEGWYWPAGHGVHAVDPVVEYQLPGVDTTAFATEPGGHAVQLAAALFEYLPASHAVQLERPELPAYEPEEHAEQASAPCPEM